MTTEPNDRSTATAVFALSRTFDAPRQTVFKACSDPAQLDRWWGPKGMNTVTSKMEFEPGGLFHPCMRMPNGQRST